MRKKARIADCKNNNVAKAGYNAEDRISALPDDISVSILSLLTLKNAVITSVLSKQWRFLWTRVTGLDFDDSRRLDRIAADPKVRNNERPNYINWVNRVTRQFRGQTLAVLRICFVLDKNSKLAVDNWIKFGIITRVQRLELDFLEIGETLRQTMGNYTFPCKFLTQRNGSYLKRLYANNLSLPACKSTGLQHLKMLTLKCVNVNNKAVNCFLFNCPLLNHLLIHGSGELVNVKVTGFILALKFLELVFFLELQSIKICDTNLVSLTYLGPSVDLTIKNAPMLDDISIGEGGSKIENDIFGQLSHCLNQLEIHTLEMYCPNLDAIKYISFPRLPNLRQLMLKVGAWGDDSLLECASWMHACPHLRRYVLQIIWMSPLKKRRKIRHAAKCPHKKLSVVEIDGYFGRVTDAEVAVYFFENAIALRRMTIDPRNQIIELRPD